MCMTNLNATILLSSTIETNEEEVNSLIGIYDSVVPIRENNSYYLNNFNIALNCCIIFDEKYIGQDNCIQLETAYEFIIRLTHVESGLGITLYKSDLYIKQEDLKTWCKNFYELKRFLKFPKIEIPKGLGSYAVKFLIRRKIEPEVPWNSQSIHSLVIGESRSNA